MGELHIFLARHQLAVKFEMGYVHIYESWRVSVTAQLFRGAVKRILRPLVRAMIGRGLTFPQLSDMLKELYIDEATRSFGLTGRRMTDSRISVLTGLQRRDVKAHRIASGEEETVPRSMGPIPRVVTLWRSDPRFCDETGEPKELERAGDSGASFDALVAQIGRDVHPRTILDEMVRLEIASHDKDRDAVTLHADSLVPREDEVMLVTYYASNLGDHAEAAAANLLAAPKEAPFFERAVHYNKLSTTSVDALEALARDRQMTVLRELNAEALRRQREDAGSEEAVERFRVGAFVFRKRERGGEP